MLATRMCRQKCTDYVYNAVAMNDTANTIEVILTQFFLSLVLK